MKTLILFLLVFFLLLLRPARSGGQVPKVRQPAVAGSFYPSDPKELARLIDDFLGRAAPAPVDNLIAIVAPHAGYVYSGGVAAYSYALLKGRKFDRVVVLAPSHYESFGFSSVYDGSAYTTPLGEIPVDHAFAARLAKMNSGVRLSGAGHTPAPGRLEHSIEVQLPFLQKAIGQFQLVPIIVGDQSYEACRALGVALATQVQGTNTLIVASSDLSHYRAYDEAARVDHKTLNAIQEYDYFDLARNLESQVWEACGGGPVVAAMIAAERLGATQAKLLHYANTGDISGDRSRVVGYGALAFSKALVPAHNEDAAFSLARGEKEALLRIAHQAVEAAVRDRRKFDCSSRGLAALEQERGAFVTLTKHGQLRGCIGYVAPIKPLYLTVRDVAMMAAVRDTRFRPVTTDELADLSYEISVLSPLRHVREVAEIRIGRDGLLIHGQGHEGLLLPQVATDEKWDRPTFLEEVCYKAGLAAHAWQSADCDLFRFTAVVFGEGRKDALLPLDLFRKPWRMRIPPGPGSLPALAMQF